MDALSILELAEIRKALVQIFAFTLELQKSNPLACYIKAPQIPSIFSESLTVHLLRRGLILPELQAATFTIGGIADVTGIQDKVLTKIEVKATGDKGFQRLGIKDLQADYLVWIHFNLFFKGQAHEPMTVWTVAKPARFFQKPGILTMKNFKLKAAALQEHSIAFDDLH